MRSTAAARELAYITQYPDLVGALRARACELQVSGATLDAVAGLPDRYCQKLMSRRAPRRLGIVSLRPLLGCALVLVESPAAMRRYGSRLDKRDERLVRHKSKEK